MTLRGYMSGIAPLVLTFLLAACAKSAPSSVLGQGAGSPGCNITFPYAGTLNGKAHYTTGAAFSGEIAWSGTQWVMYCQGGPLQDFYFSTDNVDFPWQVTTWQVGFASTPMPTVTELPIPIRQQVNRANPSARSRVTRSGSARTVMP